jgi:threo-3-hydroxy-L-aspartate ammonia-lyase
VITYDDIREAAARLKGAVHVTPLFHSRLMDDVAGGTVLLKAENVQRSGAFKFRGAFNAIAKNLDACRKSGVVTGSSGNHGGAVALAASLLGVRAVIVMPVDAAGVKVAAVRDAGAEVVKFGRTNEERIGHALMRSEREGLVMIPPYDHPDVIAGQGTCGEEIFDAGSPDLVLVPTGGGGLFAGVALSASVRSPKTEVYGVETEAARDTWLSFHERRRIRIDLPETIADGMRTLSPGELTFPLMLRHAKGVVLVSERDVREAMIFLMTRMKIVVEPTGAVGVAAVLKRRIDLGGRTAVIVLSGGNVGPAAYARIILAE